jgi:hypothetical protein
MAQVHVNRWTQKTGGALTDPGRMVPGPADPDPEVLDLVDLDLVDQDPVDQDPVDQDPVVKGHVWAAESSDVAAAATAGLKAMQA